MKKFLETIGLKTTKKVYHNLPAATLIEHALRTEDALLSENGALTIKTGEYTGRSAKDKFLVNTPTIQNEIDWNEHNQPISQDSYDKIRKKVLTHLQTRNIYVFDGLAGADPDHQQKVRVINELASQNLFMRNLLIRPTHEEVAHYSVPDITIISAPEFQCNPIIDDTNGEAAIILNIEKREVIICGTHYNGEMKKSVFVFMNYLLPKANVLPMHCSANVGENGDVAIFFGLSGTGKTTLSTDPNRYLLGDDEHGWSDQGVFNIEGGLYAKCMNLTEKNEPAIYNAIRFGSLVENVVINKDTRMYDFTDDTLAENSRVGFPMEFIPGALIPSFAGHPHVIIFLTADAFGVLPPVARLSKDQAKYHFISGYTSKVSGTEMGITTPQTTFSTCFGAPFLPFSADIYADMLGEKMDAFNTEVFLINTGWSGGPYGTGKRMPLKLTRAIVTAAVNGKLSDVTYIKHPIFNFDIPESCPNVDASVLNPRDTWADKDGYDVSARILADTFIQNFEQYENISQAIINAGPKKK